MSPSETNKPQVTEGEAYTAAVITVSDRCSRGEREDASGPALAELLGEKGYRVVSTSVVPDERPQIEDAIRGAAAARRDARGHCCRVRAHGTRHPGSHASRVDGHYAARLPFPRDGGHP